MNQEFKDRLKAERERLGLSQLELAQKIDKKKKQSFISNFETGARKATSWIVEIAHALGVDAYYLKHGVTPFVAGDKTIDQIVELLKLTADKGKTVVLDKAIDMQRQYPSADNGKQLKSSQ